MGLGCVLIRGRRLSPVCSQPAAVPPPLGALRPEKQGGERGEKGQKRAHSRQHAAINPFSSQLWGSVHGPRPALAALAVPSGGNDLTWRSPRPTPGYGAGGGGLGLGLGGGLALIYRFLRRWDSAPHHPQALGGGIPQQHVGLGAQRGCVGAVGFEQNPNALQPLFPPSPPTLPAVLFPSFGSQAALNGCGGPAQPPLPAATQLPRALAVRQALADGAGPIRRASFDSPIPAPAI